MQRLLSLLALGLASCAVSESAISDGPQQGTGGATAGSAGIGGGGKATGGSGAEHSGGNGGAAGASAGSGAGGATGGTAAGGTAAGGTGGTAAGGTGGTGATGGTAAGGAGATGTGGTAAGGTGGSGGAGGTGGSSTGGCSSVSAKSSANTCPGQPLPSGYTCWDVSGSNGSSGDNSNPTGCGGSLPGGDMVFSFVAPQSGQVNLTLNGPFEKAIYVKLGQCSNQPIQCVRRTDYSVASTSFVAAKGETYYVFIDSTHDDEWGGFDLSISY